MAFYLRSIFYVFILLLHVSLTAQVGVLQYDEEKTQEGYTLFSSIDLKETYLINNCGQVINSWTGLHKSGMSSNLMPNGLLLRAEDNGAKCCPQASVGGRLEYRNWDNEIVWEYVLNNAMRVQHHDFTLMPNGNILILGWEVITPEEQDAYGKSKISRPNLWGEFVYELKPIGDNEAEVVWEWHLQDHFVQDRDGSKETFGNISEEIGKLDINYKGPSHWSDRDWFHCNAIAYNSDRDEIMINARNIHEVWIIDHSVTSEEARGDTGGNRGKGGEFLFRWGNPAASKNGTIDDLKMFGSHGQYWIEKGLPNEGKILFFNNGDERPEGYYSTAEMIDPEVDENGDYVLNANGEYQLNEHRILYGTTPYELRSTFLSNVQQLENGNFLINEGNTGRIIEVTENEDIVWEYEIPFRRGIPIGQNSFNSYNTFRAYKYPPNYAGFENQDLEPGNYIEIFSNDLCDLIDESQDHDGDGLPYSEDCNDNDASITLPGEECDDNNPHTVGDEVGISCVCQGFCDEYPGPEVRCEISPGQIKFEWDETPLLQVHIVRIHTANWEDTLFTTANEFIVDDLENNEVLWFALSTRDVSGCWAERTFVDCFDLSSSQELEHDKLLVYPNPVRDYLQISSDYDFHSVKVFDVTGKQVIAQYSDSELNTSGLKSGVYVLCLFGKEGELKGSTQFVRLGLN